MARSQKIIMVVLGLLVIIGLAATLFFMNGGTGGANASPEEPKAQGKQPPSAAGANAPTRSAPATSSSSSAPAAPAVPVNAVYIAKATGNLISSNQATLAFQTSGRIKDIKVKEGDRVKAGDVIATLDTSALDANVIQAQAALDSAQASLAKVKAGPTVDDVVIARVNVDRAKVTLQQAQTAYDPVAWRGDAAMTSQAQTLETASSAYQAALAQYNLAINHPTDVELKSAQASLAQAQASLETAKLNASNARITAPFDGTVLWIGAKIGESTTSGSAAVTMADLPRMQVQVNVDEISGSLIKVGQSVSITVDAVPGKALTGRVTKIGLLASSSGNIVSTPVTIDIDPSPSPIYPGLSATVEFQGKTQ